MSVKTFEKNIPRETLKDLRKRIENTRWTDEVSGSDWDYGTNLAYLKKLLKYWRENSIGAQQKNLLIDLIISARKLTA